MLALLSSVFGKLLRFASPFSLPVTVLFGSSILASAQESHSGSATFEPAPRVAGIHLPQSSSDGEVWIWGDARDQFGWCAGIYRYPTRVQILRDDGAGSIGAVREIVPNAGAAIALGEDGTLWTVSPPPSPPQGCTPALVGSVTASRVPGPDGGGYLTDVIDVSGRSDSSAVLAVRKDGSLWAWGSNRSGQFGNGSRSTDLTQAAVPVQVLGPGGIGILDNVVRVETGATFVVALKSDGSVWTWGSSSPLGDLGNGTATGSYSPVQVVGPGGQGFLDEVIDIASRGRNSLALKADGTVWTWGYSGTVGRRTPMRVGATNGPGTLDGVVAISAGLFHSLALKSDGTVWAWGVNGSGELGDGTRVSREFPVQVLAGPGLGGLSDVVATSAGPNFSSALRSDGTVWTWGMGTGGQTGDGLVEDATPGRTIPAPLPGPDGAGLLRGIGSIAASSRSVLAMKTDEGAPPAGGTGLTVEASGFEFKLGFGVLASQIPETVGEPIENEHWVPNGDSLQRTTGGLLVWRRSDNWTAFTDGRRTWINGPLGLQVRANDERFEWESTLTVLSSDVISEDTINWVVGEIRNDSAAPAYDVVVQTNLFSQSGEIVGTGSGTLPFVGPGDVTIYQVYTYISGVYARIEVSASTERHSMFGYERLEVSEISTEQSEANGEIRVSATVSNPGGRILKEASLKVWFLDDCGNVVAWGGSRINPQDLPAGGAAAVTAGPTWLGSQPASAVQVKAYASGTY